MTERLKILLRYISNNRVEEYEDILFQASELNYQILSLVQYAEGKYDSSKKILILRHDIDHVSPGLRAMFLAEQKYGAHASYYFRWSTAEYRLMKEIMQYGSEASLHFETIANFMRRRCLDSRDALLACDASLELCKNVLENELRLFRSYYDVPCMTIASHGAEENTIAQISNNALTEDESIYAKLGICLEAYQKRFLEEMETYISDTDMEINGGYRYGVRPQDAIKKGLSPILFLTHPNHWKYTLKKQLRKICKMILKRPVHINDTFKRIAE